MIRKSPFMEDDTIHHRQYRNELIHQLLSKGIGNGDVLDAIGKIPRHLFIDTKHSLKEMYEDTPLEIGYGQTISQPYTVAWQTQLLDIKRGDRVLEIGTGSGYQATVLFVIGAEVYTIERRKKLYDETKRRLAILGYSGIHMFFGDGNEGLPDLAPFDKIIVTAAAPSIPDKLLKQLKPGGIMVVPVDGDVQRMFRVHKLSETETRVEDHGHFRFVPLLPGTE